MTQSKHLTIFLITLVTMSTILICFGCSPAKPSNKNLKDLVRSELQGGKQPGLFRILYRRSNHKWAFFPDSQLGWGIPHDSTAFTDPSFVNRSQILIDEKSAKIKSIEIKQWGVYNKDDRYWPCKIRTVGSAIVTGRGLKPQRKHFDAVVDYRFSKDDYGKWELKWVL